jgi:ATP-dependent exoDNAse (exonuclease V) alpha subunit
MLFLNIIKKALGRTGPVPNLPSNDTPTVRVLPSSSKAIEREVGNKTSLKVFDKAKQVIVIIGRAGTGKTTLIKEMMKNTHVKQAVVAFTGVAALNAGGQTIHSFFRIPTKIINEGELELVRGAHQLFKNLERLIIDEISMVRADLLDNVDQALRLNRHSNLPFGGVQIVMVGDFLQLPPVIPQAEARILKQMGYKTPYALSAKCLKGLTPQFFELGKIYRQADPVFIELLGNVRNGECLEEVVNTLNAKCNMLHQNTITPIILTGRNRVADAHNLKQLAALPGLLHAYEGVVSGDFETKHELFPALEYLELKIGARVALVKNDPAKRWVNGTLGTVARLEPENIWVRIDGRDDPYQIPREKWESIRYRWNADTSQIEAKVVGSYTQFPLQLAWAMTIHKAQGLTLENVRVDLQGGAFCEGQTYVALSRAKSLDGLSLAHPLSIADIRVSPELLAATRYISQRAHQL